jgi:signal transduction histidine kinase/CheY-like chemotaxis protein
MLRLRGGNIQMHLKWSTGLIISVTFFTLALALVLVFEFAIRGEFAEIEAARMRENVGRVFGALDNTTNGLVAKAIDWGQWDDTYEFMHDHSDKYLASNFTYETLASLRLKYVLYFNKTKQLYEGFKINDSKPQLDHVIKSASIVNELVEISTALDHTSLDSRRSGFVSVENKTLLYVSVPITDTRRTAPIEGSLVFIQELSPLFFDEMAKQIRLTLQPLYLNDGLKTPIDRVGLQNATKHAGTGILTNGAQEILGYGLIHDHAGKPILLLRVAQAREIYTQGTAARNFLVMCLIGLTAAALLCTLFLLDKKVLSRLEFLRSELKKITKSPDVTKRISSLGHDELGEVGVSINEMLEVIAHTQQELNEARLIAEAAKVRSLFIARVSHELRTPIHGITGICHLAIKKEKSPAVRELIKMAENAGWGLLSVINEILDFSKAESGNLTVERIAFDVRKVACEAIQIIAGRSEISEKLELVIGVDADVPREVISDPTKLKQVLINLLGNAVKFSHDGSIVLTIKYVEFESRPALKIQVADTGIGIPAEKVNSIFEPFRQVDESMSRKYQGTGLGLTIVKQFTEALGGSVSVESVVDHGSTFSILLPVGETLSEAYTLQKTGEGWAHTVLIDEESVTSESLVHHLGQLGVPVTRIHASNDKELDTIDTVVNEGDLLVVSEAALNNPRVFDAVVEMAAARQACIIALLRPFNLDLREKLHGLGIDFILPTPVLADDLILAFQGKLPIAAQSWDDNGDTRLKNAEKLRILVADDAPTNRLILEEMLTEAGHEVVCVNDGKALLDCISPMITNKPDCEHFDIILTDIQMPILDGSTAVRRIRELEKESGTERLPIIAVTAHALSHEKEEMYAAGLDGVVTKPLRAAMIAAEFERLLSHKLAATKVPATKIVETDRDLLQVVREIWKELSLEARNARHVEKVQMETLIDIADLFERSERSLHGTKVILRTFQGAFKEPLSRLAKAKISKDSTQLAEAACKLKVLLINIGAKIPGKTAADIENLCKENKFDSGARLVAPFTHQIFLLGQMAEKLCDVLDYRSDGRERRLGGKEA